MVNRREKGGAVGGRPPATGAHAPADLRSPGPTWLAQSVDPQSGQLSAGGIDPPVGHRQARPQGVAASGLRAFWQRVINNTPFSTVSREALAERSAVASQLKPSFTR